jgi:hypothetical protein
MRLKIRNRLNKISTPFIVGDVMKSALRILLLMLPLLAWAQQPEPSGGPLGILVSPSSIAPGQFFRVLAVAENAFDRDRLQVYGPQGRLTPAESRLGKGPPEWREIRFLAASEGTYRIVWSGEGKELPLGDIRVTAAASSRPAGTAAWEVMDTWTRAREALYAAWLEGLFLGAEEGSTWDNLHDVTRDPENNLLHNHLGLDEDERLVLEPDCADAPYFLRAYFSWKLGLPYGHHRCDRGTAQRTPRCGEWSTNSVLRRAGQDDVRAFQAFAIQIMNTAHSGSGRTALDDNRSDLYPVALRKDRLRPGVVYADPYGHTLTLVRWITQTENQAGRLLAMDAQPDGTIAVKRFWQGNFLFAPKNLPGGQGFKAFRPIVPDREGGLRLLSNAEIAARPEFGAFSLEQGDLSPSAFYDRMDRIINPEPIDPVTVFRELHDAVHDRLKARAIAVSNGKSYMEKTGYRTIPMPRGARIFQTTGPWEDYSTPMRDMRLLISLDVLLDFPDKVERSPDAYRLPPGERPAQIKSELLALHREWAPRYTIAYTRSNGEEQVLSLQDVLRRLDALEMGYNPNDCVEIRWGAPPGSPEFSGCSRRAPAEQIDRMRAYRRWFRDRTFPIR